MRRSWPLLQMALTLAVAIVAVGCEQQPSPGSTPDGAATANSLPVLDEYQSLFGQIDRDRLLAIAFVTPIKPGLSLEGAPPGDREKLSAYLGECRAMLDRVAELSRQAPGAFPPHPEAGTGKHMEHPMAWFQNFARMLNADAGRLWDGGDADGTARRVAAAIRLGNGLCDQSDPLDQLTGIGIVEANSGKSIALLDAGLLTRASVDAASDLRSAVTDSKALTVMAAHAVTRTSNFQTLRARLEDK